MKKKIFLFVSSLGAGGSERVFWVLSQYFNAQHHDVSIVFLNGAERCFSTQVEGVRFIDLKTIKASKSFIKLYKLIKTEKPDAIFSTTDHINMLTAMVSCFIKIPVLVARVSNNPSQMRSFYGFKARFYNFLSRFLFFRFNYIVCQTDEMSRSFIKTYHIDPDKIKVINNPVLPTPILKNISIHPDLKRLIIVCRLTKEKGLLRLLNTIKRLPDNYHLSIIGDGPLMVSLKKQVLIDNIGHRVEFKGEVGDVTQQISEHDLFVLSSFTEGFPNVVLESLSVGVPVVMFRVGGADELIREGFNGYIIEQHDIEFFKDQIINACNTEWYPYKIKTDVNERFGLDKIGHVYESLITA